MRIHNFLGERLRTARIYRGMTLTDLASETGISKQALSQYENDITNPEIGNLFILARVLDFPIEYFSIGNQYEINTQTTYFRSLMSTLKKDRVAQRVRVEFIAQIYETLFRYISFPSLKLPKVNFKGAEDIYGGESEKEIDELENVAAEVRDYWNLGKGPIKDLRYTLEANGIVVACADPNSEKIDAFSQRTVIDEHEIYLIVVSKQNQSLARARFDMAHELAHILLHPWSEDLESITKEEFKARERQANIFASAFLLPRDTFRSDVEHYPTRLEYYKYLKTKWHVSIQAMIYRTHQLRIITDSQYQYLMRQVSKNGWREKEPDDKPYIMSNNMLKSAVELLIRENKFDAEGLIKTFKDDGVVLQPSEIEELIGLEKGTLEYKVKYNPSLIKLK